MKKFFYSFICFFFLSCSPQEELFLAEKLWKTLPVQHEGRIKPFDTFSRETLRKIYGKDHYKKKSAVEIILLWLLVPDEWESTQLVFVEKDIKKSLGLDLKIKHFSVSDLSKNSKLAFQLSELQSLRQQSTELDSYFQSLEKLETRLILFSAVKSGYVIKLEPKKDQSSWLSLPELSSLIEKQITQVIKSYIALISKNMPSEKVQDGLLNFRGSTSYTEAFSNFKKNITEFKSLFVRDKKIISRIKTEVFYNSLKPFTKAWIFYLLFLLSYILLIIFKREKLFKYTIPFVCIAFCFHSLGMILRSYIMSRPPVSNMYETVI